MNPVVPYTSMNPNTSANGPAVMAAVACVLAGLGLTLATNQRAYLIAGVLLAIYCSLSIKVAKQWEKVAVLRLGRSGARISIANGSAACGRSLGEPEYRRARVPGTRDSRHS